MKKYIGLLLLVLSNTAFSQSIPVKDPLFQVFQTSLLSGKQKLSIYSQLLKRHKKLNKAQFNRCIAEMNALAKKLNDDRAFIDTYLAIGNAYRAQKQYAKSIDYYQQGLKLARSHSFNKKKADLLSAMGKSTFGQKKYTKAKGLFRQALILSKKTASEKGQASNNRALARIYRTQGKLDSAKLYYQQSLLSYQRLNDYLRMSMMYNRIGLIYKQEGKYNQALKWLRKSLDLNLTHNHKTRLGYIYNNMGLIYRRMGAFVQALEMYQKSLEHHNKNNNLHQVALVYTNIGVIHKLMWAYDQALEYYQKSLKMRALMKDEKGVARCYNNIGNIYVQQKQYDKALKYHFAGLKIKQKTKSFKSIATSYNNLGDIFFKQKHYEKALNYFEKALDICKKYNYNWLCAYPLQAIGQIYRVLGEPVKATKYLKLSLEKALQMGDPFIISLVANEFAKVNAVLGNYKEAYENHQLFKRMADSLRNRENTRKITRMETEYGFKQEKDSLYKVNMVQATQIEKESLTIRFQHKLNVLGGVVLTLVMGVLLFIYIGRQRYKKLSAQLIEQKADLQIKSEELHQSKEEISAQHDVLAHKNTELSRYQYRISKSLRAAQLIQDSLLTSRESLQAFFSDYFVIYQPKDVVSGDFFWVGKVDNKVLLVAADCTGHGVPGAFMTLIGSKLLDTIIKVNKETQPVEILKQLNQEIQTSLTSPVTKEHRIEVVAGMDAIVLCIAPEANQIYTVDFAGAKSGLLYFDTQQPNLQEIRGSRKSIGGFQSRKKTFEQHHLKLTKDSVLYMGSDGVKDQNNDQRRRFGQEALKQLLEQNRALPLKEQKQCIEETLTDYMQGTEQRDDILWMGVKL